MKKSKKKAKQSKKKSVTGPKTKKSVFVNLTDSEMQTKSKRLACLEIDKTYAEDQRRESSAKAGKEIKEIQSEITTLSKQIDEGTQQKEVMCTIVKNYNDNTVEYWHKDKKVDDRQMMEDDRQMDMASAKKTKKKFTNTPKMTADESPNAESGPGLTVA